MMEQKYNYPQTYSQIKDGENDYVVAVTLLQECISSGNHDKLLDIFDNPIIFKILCDDFLLKPEGCDFLKAVLQQEEILIDELKDEAKEEFYNELKEQLPFHKQNILQPYFKF